MRGEPPAGLRFGFGSGLSARTSPDVDGGRSQAEMERALLQGEREAERALLQQEQRAADQLQEKLVALETGIQKERDKVTTPAGSGRAGRAWERRNASPGPSPLPSPSHLQTRWPCGRGYRGGACPPREVAHGGPPGLGWSPWSGPPLAGSLGCAGVPAIWALLGSAHTPAGTVSTAEGPVETVSSKRASECSGGLQESPQVSAPLSLQDLQLHPCPSQV